MGVGAPLRTLRLRDGIAEAVLCPDLGGGVASYDLVGRGGRRALFRRAGPAPADALALACAPLVPWSNRISGGGFEADGGFVTLAANWPGEPCPLHGNGMQARWQVAGHDARAAELTLDSDGPGAFRYAATLRYWLRDGALGMRLAVRHRGAAPLPYGLGFHPWFPRTAATTLQARADAVWLEDARHLPTRRVPLAERPAWDFAAGRALPPGWINNGFVGWDGRATIGWPGRGLALAVEAAAEGADGAAPLAVFLVYSPGAQADFFCFEPVSHPVDAHHLAGRPGLFRLAPGQSAAVQCRFLPREIAGAPSVSSARSRRRH